MDDLSFSVFQPRWQLLLSPRHLEWLGVWVSETHLTGPVSFIDKDVGYYLIPSVVFVLRRRTHWLDLEAAWTPAGAFRVMA